MRTLPPIPGLPGLAAVLVVVRAAWSARARANRINAYGIDLQMEREALAKGGK